MRKIVNIEDDLQFGSAKERDAYEKKPRPAKRYTLKYLSAIKTKSTVSKYTKNWSRSEIEIILNNPVDVRLTLIINKREKHIISKHLKLHPKPKKIKDIGLPLDLNYKNDYSKPTGHLPATKCLNKKLIRIALRKS